MTDVAVLDEREPWERRHGESAKAFEAFSLYRDLLAARSLAKVAQAIAESQPERALATIRHQVGEWSRENGWVERAEHYDVYLDRKLRAERETEIERLNRQHGQLGGALLSIAAVRVTGREADPARRLPAVEALDPNTLDAGDVAALFREGVKTQRLAIGLPTDFTRNATNLSPAVAAQIWNTVIEIALRYIDDPKKPLFVHAVNSFAEGRGS